MGSLLSTFACIGTMNCAIGAPSAASACCRNSSGTGRDGARRSEFMESAGQRVSRVRCPANHLVNPLEFTSFAENEKCERSVWRAA